MSKEDLDYMGITLIKGKKDREKNYPMDECKWITDQVLGETRKRHNILRHRKEIKFEEA